MKLTAEGLFVSDALALIDTRTVPYLTGSPTEKRLINLAIYEMLLVAPSVSINPSQPRYTPSSCRSPDASPERRPIAARAPAEAREPAPKTAVAPIFGATV